MTVDGRAGRDSNPSMVAMSLAGGETIRPASIEPLVKVRPYRHRPSSKPICCPKDEGRRSDSWKSSQGGSPGRATLNSCYNSSITQRYSSPICFWRNSLAPPAWAGGRRPPSTPNLNQASSFSIFPSWRRPDPLAQSHSPAADCAESGLHWAPARSAGDPTGHDRFRQRVACNTHIPRPLAPICTCSAGASGWRDLRLKDKVPRDQRVYVDKIIQPMTLCRNRDGGYTRSQWVLT